MGLSRAVSWCRTHRNVLGEPWAGQHTRLGTSVRWRLGPPDLSLALASASPRAAQRRLVPGEGNSCQGGAWALPRAAESVFLTNDQAGQSLESPSLPVQAAAGQLTTGRRQGSGPS